MAGNNDGAGGSAAEPPREEGDAALADEDARRYGKFLRDLPPGLREKSDWNDWLQLPDGEWAVAYAFKSKSKEFRREDAERAAAKKAPIAARSAATATRSPEKMQTIDPIT